LVRAVVWHADFSPAWGLPAIVSGQSSGTLSQTQDRRQQAPATEAAKTVREEGIPVTDPLVRAKCGNCHASDERGNMQRISWERTTPEGWQDVLKRMIVVKGVAVTPSEARSIVKYLSTYHELAPEEAKPVMYDAERRIHDETNIPNENLRGACAKCHALARPLSWRRSIEEWKLLADMHVARYKIQPNEEAIAFLAKTAPLHTPEWTAWSTRTLAPNLAGRWLVSINVPGRGKYYGEMEVDPAGDDEFNTRVRLTSVKDGSTILRSGRSAVYGGYAWRGRSKGSEPASSAPDDLSSEVREVMWIAPDQAKAEGRWFWGQYQEFGFDVTLQRPSSDPTLMGVDQSSLKTASRANRIRLIGDNIPSQVRPADLDLGPGVSVRRIVSRTPSEVVAEVDVVAEALPGKRDAAFRRSVIRNAVAIYDRIDYVKVTPESALAAFGSQVRPRGYQQFEAIGYQRGADGKPHTADDVELGPVDVSWSMEVFYTLQDSSTDFVGKLSPTGFFTPASDSANNNYDVWVIATAKSEKGKDGKPLVGKSYLVVTVPMYTLNGRQYVRDLDRWIDNGPARGRQ
jgi:quinohemoprotein amine dehydrogenase